MVIISFQMMIFLTIELNDGMYGFVERQREDENY